MKHSELEAYLSAYLQMMDISLSPLQTSMLARHIDLALEANCRVNLTRITDRQDAVRLHTADSLAILEDVSRAPAGSLLDVGTGAGFPGIPLAICTDRPVVLVDSVGKKVREVEAMVGSLGLSTRVKALAARAEAIGRSNRGEYAVVTARAVSELPALVELGAPLLAPGGRLLCLKGTPPQEEVDRADRVAALVGLNLEYARSLDLPEKAGHRTVFCYARVGESRVPLPRREGLAQHAPLA